VSTPTSTPATESAARPRNSHRVHRWVCIVGGALAVVGGTLGALVDPMWGIMAALGGLGLLAFPDAKCCSR
jgi:hypothetical protein